MIRFLPALAILAFAASASAQTTASNAPMLVVTPSTVAPSSDPASSQTYANIEFTGGGAICPTGERALISATGQNQLTVTCLH